MKTLFQSLFLAVLLFGAVGANAQVTVTPTSGPGICDATATYDNANVLLSYVWLNAAGDTIAVNTPTITGLCDGDAITLNYMENGAIISYTFVVGQTDPCAGFIAYANVISNPSDPALCDGAAEIIVMGGSGPYLYNWSNGVIGGSSQTDLCVGTYTVVVTDANGCSSTTSFYAYPDSVYSFGAYVTTVDESTAGSCDGEVTVYTYGGVAPFTYLHSNGATSEVSGSLCSGLYNVIVTDANGQEVMLPYMIASTVISNPFPNPNPLDTIFGGIYQNCDIEFGIIDSANIVNWNPAGLDSIVINWAVYDSSGVTTFTTTIANPGNGSYVIDLAVYCPWKSVGNYIRIYDEVTITSGNLGITALENATVNAYPNPFTNELNIQVSEVGDYSVSIIDMLGRVVLNENFENTANMQISSVSALQSGKYLLKIANEKETIVRTIVK